MFKEVDPSQEAALLASLPKSRGPDLTDRSVTNWFKGEMKHKLRQCTIPDHESNVPEHDHDGKPYDKTRTRMCIAIDPFWVCRWCFLAKADETNTIPLDLPQLSHEDK